MNTNNSAAGKPAQSELQGFLRVVKRGWFVIVLAALAGGSCAVLLSLLQEPVYRANVELYVTSGAEANAQSAYQGSLASQQRVASYARLIASQPVLSEALRSSGLQMTADEAATKLRAEATPETVLLTVSADDANPTVAAALADSVAQAMTAFVTELEKPADGGTSLAKLTVVKPASVGDDPVAPQTRRNLLLGLVAGTVVGVLVLYVRWKLDTKVRSQDDLVELVDYPVLSVVPRDPDLGSGRALNFGIGASAAAEAFRRLRTNLGFVNVDGPVTRLIVTSARASEGKTTSAVNVASALAEAGHKVLLVDADLRRPRVADRLPVDASVGLSDVLRGSASWQDLVQQSGIDSLDVLGPGQLPPNSAELLGSNRAKECMAELSARYDYVIVDTPPVLPVTDAAVVAQLVDGALLVARAGATQRRDITSAVEQLRGTHSMVQSLCGLRLVGRGPL
ncbi:polysaccharide biosynthesis tyrosine autokinase [Gordonia alkanivorans]|uniref:polysaccharide biosynthesis tyrosine autokinase n=1 Tax=Gordonia alkanivorans TaxID=84096 RepID=UPI002449AB01|nr:polysaccharide biosynthesis tyrosine autokinase [Gordonia alkanivorans]MDH3052483.1 polysaccharide biosynthesis tyrosine autokinase [Gordonia alkanivorans]